MRGNLPLPGITWFPITYYLHVLGLGVHGHVHSIASLCVASATGIIEMEP